MSSVDLLEEFNKLQLDTYEEPQYTDEILGGESMKRVSRDLSLSQSLSLSPSLSQKDRKENRKKKKVEDGAESKIRFEAYDIKKRAPILTDGGNPITLTGGKKVYDAKEENGLINLNLPPQQRKQQRFFLVINLEQFK